MDLVSLAKDFLRKNNVNINVIEGSGFGLARYNPQENIFEIDPQRIEQSAKEISIPVEDNVILVMSHELGHYFDKERPVLQQKINVLLQEIEKGNYCEDIENEIIQYNEMLEKNAWEIGSKFVPLELIDKYNVINQKNLKVTSINKIRLVYELKNNAEKQSLVRKILDLLKEIEELKQENIKLMEENYELKFGKKINF